MDRISKEVKCRADDRTASPLCESGTSAARLGERRSVGAELGVAECAIHNGQVRRDMSASDVGDDRYAESPKGVENGVGRTTTSSQVKSCPRPVRRVHEVAGVDGGDSGAQHHRHEQGRDVREAGEPGRFGCPHVSSWRPRQRPGTLSGPRHRCDRLDGPARAAATSRRNCMRVDPSETITWIYAVD